VRGGARAAKQANKGAAKASAEDKKMSDDRKKMNDRKKSEDKAMTK